MPVDSHHTLLKHALQLASRRRKCAPSIMPVSLHDVALPLIVPLFPALPPHCRCARACGIHGPALRYGPGPAVDPHHRHLPPGMARKQTSSSAAVQQACWRQRSWTGGAWTSLACCCCCCYCCSFCPCNVGCCRCCKQTRQCCFPVTCTGAEARQHRCAADGRDWLGQR